MSEDELKRSEIERERQEKDKAFKYAHESPIPHEEKDTFQGLKYYPVNARYRFAVRLEKHASPDIVVMATSTGTQQRYLCYGSFKFSMDDKEYQLRVFKPEHSHVGEESLFVPFHDGTSGSETYGTGR
jgi:hypothetical protein